MTAAPLVPRLWNHQKQAYRFIKQLWESGRPGGMLAMWMGTGKTRVAVELAGWLQARRVLILCPLRVVEVWRTQTECFAPGAYEFVALDQGSVLEKTCQARRMLAWATGRRRRLAVSINYESARLDPFASWALANVWDLVICDESHRIKEAAGRTSLFCARLGMRARRRLALTGTPMPHQPIDIWGQFRFLDPNILDPTYGSFKLRHAVMGGYYKKQVTAWKDLDRLQQQFASIAFLVAADVLDLPQEMDQTLSADLGKSGALMYREMETEMVTWIRGQEEAGEPVTAANALVRLLRLQQITGGSLPDASGALKTIDDAKENLLADFLEDLPREEPLVVFAVFKGDLAAVHRACARHKLTSGELSGARDDLARWQRGGPDDPTVLAVQIQAGDVGIDLTRARLAVYYSLGFSLVNYLQSRARIRRPPQKRPCVFYHLRIRHSIDEYVIRAVGARRDLIESVLEEIKSHA